MSLTECKFNEKMTDFALELYRQTVANKPDRNLVLSPASISIALAMAHRGAQGKTRDQMTKLLFGQDISEDKVQQGLTQMSQVLNQPLSDGLVLKSANGLFVDDHFGLLGDYVTEANNIFQAQAVNVSFCENSQQAVNHINDWVAEKTNGKIDKLFDKLDGNVKLILANAIYFKVGNHQLGFKFID